MQESILLMSFSPAAGQRRDRCLLVGILHVGRAGWSGRVYAERLYAGEVDVLIDFSSYLAVSGLDEACKFECS